MSMAEVALPVLRPDLEFLAGPDDADGAPTYLIHDPLRATFDKATWWQMEILRALRRPVTLAALRAHLARTTTIPLGADEICRFGQDLGCRGLTRSPGTRSPADLEADAAGPHPLVWLLHHYLYFRVPLLRPDRLLEGLRPLARGVRHPVVRLVLMAVGLLGVLLLAQRWQAYLVTFPRFFSWEGALSWTLALAALKSLHEFAHGCAAKTAGCRVPTMGVAFMVFCPVPYADVTDTWRLSRRERLRVSLAGVRFELAVAGIALCGWALTPAGILNSLCFLLSSSTMVSSLLVNLNPAMRFDGYYILMDLWGIDNLQPRAFAVMRWWYRRVFLGVESLPPEAGCGRGRVAGMVIYSLYTWTYRFFLYLGIAIFVYHAFFKALGILLFLVEAGFFLVRPVVMEVRSLMRMKGDLSWNRRSLVAALVVAGLCLWALLPLPRRHTLPALTIAGRQQVLQASHAGRIRAIHAGRGALVAEGQVLLELGQPEVEAECAVVEAEIRRVQDEIRQVSGSAGARSLLPEKQEDLARLAARRQSLRQQLAEGQVVSAMPGTITAWDETLRVGMDLSRQAELGTIADLSDLRVRAYVPESLVQALHPGDLAVFLSRARGETRTGRISRISPVRSVWLEDRALASVAGGALAVHVDASHRLVLVDGCYEIEVVFEEERSDGVVGEVGGVLIWTQPRSFVADLVRHALHALVQESGF